MAEETAGRLPGPDPDLDPAERRLLAAMPLHAITSVHGQAGLRAQLLMEIERLPAADRGRDRGRADLAGPLLATNIAVPSLHARKRSVYFLPDRILVRDGRHYADMPYSSCRVTGTATRFIEEGPVPRDGERIGITWKYVNKGGGPDRRYKNNPQLPIMRYGS